MKSHEDIERFVKTVDCDTARQRDGEVRAEIMEAHAACKRKRQPTMWSIPMRSNKARLATAATILLAVVLGVTVLDWTTAPAWALEQTIEALKNVRSVYIAGRMRNPGQDSDEAFEIWAVPHSEDPTRSGDFRYREGDDHLCVASESENVTYVCTEYDEIGQAVVYVTAGLNRGTSTFPGGDLLAAFREMAEQWKEEIRKDPETGKLCVYVTFSGPAVNTAKYWVLQVDLETKLPVRTAVWFEADREGPPHYEYTTLEYDPEIPEGWFDFAAPAGAQVVDCRELENVLGEGADCGVAVDGLDETEACTKVVAAYWEAVIAKDWEAVSTLRPLATGSALDELKAAYAGSEVVEQVDALEMNHLGDPGTFVEVTCLVKGKDGATYESLLNVRVADGIGVVAGVLGAELRDAD